MFTEKIKAVLSRFGINEINAGVSTGTVWHEAKGDISISETPIDGSIIAKIKNADIEDYEKVMKTAQEAFLIWRNVPAPKRGEIVRQIGLALRDAKEDLRFSCFA